jgi:formylmethanofuran dehydrogenase subunit E
MAHREDAGSWPEEVRKAAEFHTHLGPYLVVGLRMGHAITRELGSVPFSYRIVARTGRKPPYSCLADGLQVATPCTTGNGGLEVAPEKTMSAEATTRAGETVVVTLRGDVYESIENECTEDGQEAFALGLWGMPEEQLLEVRRKDG